jgi:inner membrane protein involved in colicin E2 resistance
MRFVYLIIIGFGILISVAFFASLTPSWTSMSNSLVTNVTASMNSTYLAANSTAVPSYARLENGLGVGLWFIGLAIVGVYVFQMIMKQVRGSDDSGQGDDY